MVELALVVATTVGGATTGREGAELAVRACDGASVDVVGASITYPLAALTPTAPARIHFEATARTEPKSSAVLAEPAPDVSPRPEEAATFAVPAIVAPAAARALARRRFGALA